MKRAKRVKRIKRYNADDRLRRLERLALSSLDKDDILRYWQACLNAGKLPKGENRVEGIIGIWEDLRETPPDMAYYLYWDVNPALETVSHQVDRAGVWFTYYAQGYELVRWGSDGQRADLRVVQHFEQAREIVASMLQDVIDSYT